MKQLKENELILQFFVWQHLPIALQEVSMPFCILAKRLVDTLPRNPERSTALRKLLEAKDCAVRARLWEDQSSDLAATGDADHLALGGS